MISWMDLGDITLSEMSDKDKYCMISLTCGILNKTKQKQIHRYREQIGGCQRWGEWGWAKWVKVVKIK